MDRGLAPIALCLLLACGGGSDSSEPDASLPGPSGTLVVDVNTASGVNVEVSVEGPDGFAMSFSATQQIEVPVGDITINAAPGRLPGEFVDELHLAAAESQTVAVGDGETVTASVDYARVPGTARVWLGNELGRATGLGASQLGMSGAVEPEFEFLQRNAANNARPAFAVDSRGNVYLSSCDPSDIAFVRFNAADTVTSNAPTPAVTIRDDRNSSACAFDLAFASDGRLAVAKVDGIEIYTPAQLEADGAPTPISIGEGRLEGYGVTWSPTGGLWVADLNGGQLLFYSEAQLAQSGDPEPAASWTGADVNSIGGVAFDAEGNMFTTSPTGIRVYPPAAQAMPTVPSPARLLESSEIQSPTKPAFDNQGNLWVPQFQPSADLLVFAQADLVTAGQKFPRIIELTRGSKTTTFSPPPSNLPIYTP